MDKNLWSLAEAAREIGITRAALQARIQRGDVHATRVGTQWVIAERDLAPLRGTGKLRTGPKPRTPIPAAGD